jgi:hypothetical protein
MDADRPRGDRRLGNPMSAGSGTPPFPIAIAEAPRGPALGREMRGQAAVRM